MPNNIIKSFAKQTGKSEAEVEKLWDEAKLIAKKDRSEDDEDFYPYVTGILKKMLSIKESISEETGSAAVAMPQGPLQNKMPCGTKTFDCDEEDFFGLHLKAKRNKGQWFKKYYNGEKNQDLANWCKSNKGKSFYLHYNDMFRKVKNW